MAACPGVMPWSYHGVGAARAAFLGLGLVLDWDSGLGLCYEKEPKELPGLFRHRGPLLEPGVPHVREQHDQEAHHVVVLERDARSIELLEPISRGIWHMWLVGGRRTPKLVGRSMRRNCLILSDIPGPSWGKDRRMTDVLEGRVMSWSWSRTRGMSSSWAVNATCFGINEEMSYWTGDWAQELEPKVKIEQ